MRWLLVNCILLATAAHVLSGHRPKRDLAYIKNIIASKIFGTETIFIQIPEIPKNESHQLFKIKGRDDFIIKVTRKPENKKEKVQAVKETIRDPVIVNPEIAIIGSYLGTSTRDETGLAIEFVKKLLKSGILNSERDRLMQGIVPITPQEPYKNYFTQEPLKPVNVFTENREPIYIFPPVNEQAERIKFVNPVSSQQYPPLIVASEVKYKPVQAKYSYKQKGETGDMTFESYNNQDVIVTRTVKEPQLPEHIKLRFAEVASIVANPYLIGSYQPVSVIPEEHFEQPMNNMHGSFGILNPSDVIRVNTPPAHVPSYVMNRFSTAAQPAPGFTVVENPGYLVANNIDGHPIWIDRNSGIFSDPLAVPNVIKDSRLPFNIKDHLTEAELDKMNRYINGKLQQSKSNINGNVDTLKAPSNNAKVSEKVEKVNHKEDANIEKHRTNFISENRDLNDTTVTHYLYKQMNHNSHENYTVVKVEDSPKVIRPDLPNKIDVAKSVDNVPDDFIFMPPENVDIPLPNMIPKTNNIDNQNMNNENSSQSDIYPKTFDVNIYEDDKLKVLNEKMGPLRMSEFSLANDPIVVLEDKDQNKNPVTSYRESTSSFGPYTGGPVF